VKELKEACLAATQAGARVLRDLAGRPRDIHFKGRIDLVTDADKASEEAVLRVLRERVPGARVLAEESGESGAGDVRFIVDPLDGTTNYAHGLPLYCCTVAAETGGVLDAGCTVDPTRGEVFLAERGGGATLNGNPLRVSDVTRLDHALVCTGFPYGDREKLPQMISAFGRLTQLARGSRRLGSAALDLAYVASGRLDAFWELGLKPWDVGAGVLLVQEAFGVVTRGDGSPHRLAGGDILACAPGIQGAMLEQLAVAAATSAR
jgi:myo-inositol-1(or 4)-monophosphatase